MAKLRSGILGNIRGKVAGVVGGQWKDKNYLREYVKPANPNTTLQAAQRSKMSAVVALAKPLVGMVFNPYTDKFQKSMSGFNRFVSNNIALAPDFADTTLIKVTEGNIYAPQIAASVYDTSDGYLTTDFSTSLGSDGLSNDEVFCVVYHQPTGRWFSSDGTEPRSAGQIVVSIGEGLTASDVTTYLFAARRVNDLLTKISSNTAAVATAA